MSFLTKIFIICHLVTLLFGCAFAQESEKNLNLKQSQAQTQLPPFNKARTKENFADYVVLLKQYAKWQGIDDATIKRAFQHVYFIEHVVKADKNQPEKKLTLDDYLKNAVSPQRIQLAQKNYLQHHSALTQATLITQIPQTYILALWGVESAYGKYQGKEDIISALSTLAFDGRREAFFVKELISALTILQQGHIAPSQFKGSWAGAMGQNQFMPSSFLRFAKDGDNDGIIDIWHNQADVFASIGNYLATVGWDASVTWGAKVMLPKNLPIDYAGLADEQAKSTKAWLKLGVQFVDKQKILNNSTQSWLIIPDEGSRYGYLVSSNFKTLMHWNRSYHFAVSVGMLADSLTDKSVKLPIKS